MHTKNLRNIQRNIQRNKNRYASNYAEVLNFLKHQRYEVLAGSALDEAAIAALNDSIDTQGHWRRIPKAQSEAARALYESIKKNVAKLIHDTPDSTALPLLFWMSHQCSAEAIESSNDPGPNPDWRILRYVLHDNGAMQPAPDYHNSREEIKSLLLTCFETSPKLFIDNFSVLSPSFRKAIESKSPYNNHLRLKYFIQHHAAITHNPKHEIATEKLLDIYRLLYLKKDMPSQKGELIIALLSAAYLHPIWRADAIFNAWPAILKKDTTALKKHKNKNKLFQAAREALKRPINSDTDIAMKIDHLSEYKYRQTSLSARDKHYRRIKYHLEKDSKKNRGQADNTTSNVSKEFHELAKSNAKLKSTPYVKEAIEHAVQNIDLLKLALANGDIKLASRSETIQISIRLTNTSSNQLRKLVEKLKGADGLPSRVNGSVALELAVLFLRHENTSSNIK